MPDRQVAGQKKQEKADQTKRVPQIDSPPASQNPLAWDADSYLGNTPFNPPVQRHVALLSGASSEQRVTISRKLQQTYGNRYVQRLSESIMERTKAAVDTADSGEVHQTERIGRKPSRGAKKEPGGDGKVSVENNDTLFILYNFDNGKTNIKPAFKVALDQISGIFRSGLVKGTVVIHGHASQTGPKALNDRLAEERAQRIAQYLTGNGLLPFQISEIKGFSSDVPIADNKTLEGQSKNRRVEIKLIIEREPIEDKPKQSEPPKQDQGGKPKQKTKRVPVQWIEHSVQYNFDYMFKRTSFKNTTLIREEYQDVPEDQVELGLQSTELKREIFMASNVRTIKRYRATYGPSTAGSKALTVLNVAAKIATVLNGDLLESQATEVYDSWDKYPRRKGGSLEEFRP